MIAVTFALKSESADFLRLLDNKRTADGGGHAVAGNLRGVQVLVLHTGVGGRLAHARTSTFLRHDPPRLLISSGFAGALHDGWNPGEILLARNFSNTEPYEAARAALAETGKPGELTTTAAIVDSPARRAELARDQTADAVDMETEFIAQACASKGIPILSLRAISDTPAASFPAPAAVLFDVEQQRTHLSALALYLAKNPGAVPRFIRFARQIAAARAALARGLAVLLKDPVFSELR